VRRQTERVRVHRRNIDDPICKRLNSVGVKPTSHTLSSGRDTLAFLKRGFRVEAIEPSIELAALSQKLTGVTPRPTRVQDLTDETRFDGVWACASLVHVPLDELPNTLERVVQSALPSAPIYITFKHGHGMRIAGDGRPYTDLNEADLNHLLSPLCDVRVAEKWLSEGLETSGGQRDLWLNVILLRGTV
jgi:hypothetical protein